MPRHSLVFSFIKNLNRPNPAPFMNYLYSEKTISNPVDSVLLLENHILVHHHSTIKVYDLSFVLQHEKYFIDKILSLKKINDTTVAILFDRGKIVQCTASFAPTCLRIIDGDRLDSYNSNCVVYNKIKAHTFNAHEEEIKEFYYSTFEIYNVQSVSYMINYIPTLLITWKTNDFSKCSAINLDGIPAKVDEFEILEDTIYHKSLDRFIVFVTRNCIQIKFKREMVILIINQNLPSASLKSHFSQCVIEASNDGSYEAQNIFVENPQVFGKGDDLFVANGNGELFKISLKLDVKKILKAHISFEGRFVEPSCADFDENHVVLGSLKSDTALYSFDSLIDENGASSCALSEISKLESIGLICNFSHDKNRDIHFLTTKGAYVAQHAIDLEPHEKVKIEMKVTKLEIVGDDLVAHTVDKTSTFKLGDNLSTSAPAVSDGGSDTVHSFDPLNILSKAKYLNYDIIHLNDGTLVLFDGEAEIKSFSEVKVWSLEHERLAVVTLKGFFIFSIDQVSVIFFCSKLSEFSNEIYNEQIIHRPHIEEMQASSISEIRKNCGCGYISENEDGMCSEPIVEVLLRKEHFWFVLLRTEGQLYLYKLCAGHLSKTFLPKVVSFFTSSRSLFNLSGFVYCRSKVPYCIFLRNGVFIHKCSLRINHPVDKNEWLYAMYKGHLLRCRIKQLADGFSCNNKLLIRQISSSLHQHLPEHKERLNGSSPPEQPVSLLEDYRESEVPKYVIHAIDCIVLSIARYVPFTYVPFIPMVHISDGPDGKPHSEPINKEEAEYINKNPALRGRTLRYYVDLYSLDYKLMSSIEMEENEIICDLKLILDNFLVICTSFTEGEDKAVKGRAIVYSLIDIVPDPSHPHINKKLKLIGSESFKNACLQCEEIRGLLALCIGTRLMIYELNINTGLAAVGRNEIALLCTSLFVTKNFLAISDIYTGVYFFFLRPRDPLKLHLLGKSSRLNNIRFLQGLRFSSPNCSADQLSLLAYDKSGSIHIFTYSPNHPAANGGNILIKRAHINTKLRYPLWFTKSHQSEETCSMYVSNCVLVTVKGIEIQKIQAIHHCISITIDNTCGLNPINYLETEDFVNPECKGIISERILLEFFFLSPSLQQRVCNLVGINYQELSGAIEMCLQD